MSETARITIAVTFEATRDQIKAMASRLFNDTDFGRMTAMEVILAPPAPPQRLGEGSK